MTGPVQFTRGNLAAWQASSKVLADGQLGVARHTDGSAELKVGNGVDDWSDLDGLNTTEAVARSLGWKIADDYGADPTGTADSTAALQACFDAAVAAGQPAYAAGTFKITGTVTVKGDADLHAATFNYTPGGAGGIALSVGAASSQLIWATVRAPRITNTKKTTTGWAQAGVSGSVGVRLVNAYSCSLTLPKVTSFETGLLVTGIPIGAAIQGTQQCGIRPLHLDNNKVNLKVAPYQGTSSADSGWANQNTVFGGRLSHNSNEGTAVSGVKHVEVATAYNIVNGWLFVGTSLESPDVVDYHIDTYGQYCTWVGCRFENTGGDVHRKVRSRGTAKANFIDRGFNAGQITQSLTDTAFPFDTDTDVQTALRGGDSTAPRLLLENTFSSTAPVLTIMEAGAALSGAAPATAWAVKTTAQQWAGKRAADSNPRIVVDNLNGRLYVGDAAAAITRYFGSFGTSMAFAGADVCYVTNDTYDFGETGFAPRYIRAARAVQTGAFATGARPTAAAAKAGAMIFDTTLGKPIWSTGSAWVDATGATV